MQSLKRKNTNMANETEIHDAIRIILEDKPAYATSLNYAVDYCRTALGMRGEALRVQCLYILNNITHWRGDGSKLVRAMLKAYVASK
jgi:hypothetical protein